MEHLQFIALSLAMWLPFAYLLLVALFIIQLPLAIIHRYAVYVAILFKVLIESSFLSFLAHGLSAVEHLSIIPFHIVFVSVLFLHQMKTFKKDGDSSWNTFNIATWVLSIFTYLTVSISPAKMIYSIFYEYVNGFYFLLSQPTLSLVLKPICYIVGGIYLLWTIIKIIIVISSWRNYFC